MHKELHTKRMNLHNACNWHMALFLSFFLLHSHRNGHKQIQSKRWAQAKAYERDGKIAVTWDTTCIHFDAQTNFLCHLKRPEGSEDVRQQYHYHRDMSIAEMHSIRIRARFLLTFSMHLLTHSSGWFFFLSLHSLVNFFGSLKVHNGFA